VLLVAEASRASELRRQGDLFLQEQLSRQAADLRDATAMMELQRRQAEVREAEFRNELAAVQLKASFAAQEVGLQKHLAEALEAGREARAAANEAVRLKEEAASAFSEAQEAQRADAEERSRLDAARVPTSSTLRDGGSTLRDGGSTGSEGTEGSPLDFGLNRSGAMADEDNGHQFYFPLPSFLFPGSDSALSELIDTSTNGSGGAPSPSRGLTAVGLSQGAWGVHYAAWLGVSPDSEKALFHVLESQLSQGLPSSWSLHVDAKGRAYFWNGLSNESLWTHPDHEIFNAIIRLFRLSLQHAEPTEFLDQILTKLSQQDVSADARWSGPFLAEDGNQYWYDSEKDASMWYDPFAESSRQQALKLALVSTLLGALGDEGEGLSPEGAALPGSRRERRRRIEGIGGVPSVETYMPSPMEVLMRSVVPLEAEYDSLSEHVALNSAPHTDGGSPAESFYGHAGHGPTSVTSNLSRSASVTFGLSPASVASRGGRGRRIDDQLQPAELAAVAGVSP